MYTTIGDTLSDFSTIAWSEHLRNFSYNPQTGTKTGQGWAIMVALTWRN